MAEKSIIAEIARLNRMPVAELKARYEQVFGKPASATDRNALFREIARRIQEDEYGAAPETEKPRRKVIKTGHPVAGRRLLPGTTLVRHYQGQRVAVKVLGRREFEYEGRVYNSLSKIANEITGTHTSGPRWFGLTGSRRKK